MPKLTGLGTASPERLNVTSRHCLRPRKEEKSELIPGWPAISNAAGCRSRSRKRFWISAARSTNRPIARFHHCLQPGAILTLPFGIFDVNVKVNKLHGDHDSGAYEPRPLQVGRPFEHDPWRLHGASRLLD